MLLGTIRYQFNRRSRWLSTVVGRVGQLATKTVWMLRDPHAARLCRIEQAAAPLTCARERLRVSRVFDEYGISLDQSWLLVRSSTTLPFSYENDVFVIYARISTTSHSRRAARLDCEHPSGRWNQARTPLLLGHTPRSFVTASAG